MLKFFDANPGSGVDRIRIPGWKKSATHTGRAVHDDHFGVVVEPLGRPVDEMKQIVEAYCLIGPGLEARLQHPARLAVDVCLRNLSRENYKKI
jgi:hypothetical protein